MARAGGKATKLLILARNLSFDYFSERKVVFNEQPHLALSNPVEIQEATVSDRKIRRQKFREK